MSLPVVGSRTVIEGPLQPEAGGEARRTLLRTVAAAILLALAIEVLLVVFGLPRRWRWWFTTANDLGVVMAAVLGVACGILATIDGVPRRWRTGLRSLLLGGVVIMATALVASCSRSGWLGLAAGAALAGWCCRHAGLRRILIVVCAAVALAILLAPRAQARARTLSAPFEDGSVQARIEMWSGATALIADHPWSGCGPGRFPDVDQDWYLPRYRGMLLYHAFNDTLNIASEHGVVAGALFIAVLLTALAAMAWLAAIRGDAVAAGLASGLAVVTVGGAFGTVMIDGAAPYPIALVIAAAARLAWCAERWRILARSAAIGGAAAVAVAVAILMVGRCQADSLAYLPVLSDAMLEAVPRHGDPRATVVVVRGPGDVDREVAEHLMRRLAGAGYRVIAPGGADEAVPDLALWRPPTADAVTILLAMHGATQAVMQAWSAGRPAWMPAAAILLDVELGAGQPMPIPPCPVYVADGSRAAADAPDAAVAALLAMDGRNRWVVAAPSVLWPRYYASLHDGIVEWLGDTLFRFERNEERK